MSIAGRPNLGLDGWCIGETILQGEIHNKHCHLGTLPKKLKSTFCLLLSFQILSLEDLFFLEAVLLNVDVWLSG